MTTAPPGAVEVRQADKDAAHAMIRRLNIAAQMSLTSPERIYEAFARHRLSAAPQSQAALVDAWKGIESAPKDRTIIWAIMRDDIYPALRPGREDLKPWNGVQIPLRHPGVCDDGFDMGWNVAAPVGHGGFPDEWIAGWMPLPKPPALSLAGGDV